MGGEVGGGKFSWSQEPDSEIGLGDNESEEPRQWWVHVSPKYQKKPDFKVLDEHFPFPFISVENLPTSQDGPSSQKAPFKSRNADSSGAKKIGQKTTDSILSIHS